MIGKQAFEKRFRPVTVGYAEPDSFGIERHRQQLAVSSANFKNPQKSTRFCCRSIPDNDSPVHLLVPRTAKIVAKKIVGSGLHRLQMKDRDSPGR